MENKKAESHLEECQTITMKLRFTIANKLILLFIIFGLFTGFFSVVVYRVVDNIEVEEILFSNLPQKLEQVKHYVNKDPIKDCIDNKNQASCAIVNDVYNYLQGLTERNLNFNLFYYEEDTKSWKSISISDENNPMTTLVQPSMIDSLDNTVDEEIIHRSDTVYSPFDSHSLFFLLDKESKIILEVYIAAKNLDKMLSHFLYILPVMIIAILLFSLVLGKLLARRFVRPLEQLERGSEEISRQNYGYQIQSKRKDEFQKLIDNFNHTSLSLKTNYKEVHRLNKELYDLFWGSLKALSIAIDENSNWTSGHSLRVEKYAKLIGEKIGLSTEKLEQLKMAAIMHDIGKIGIPGEILDKTGPLTPEELRIIQMHPEKGARILREITAYKDIVEPVLQHHEKYDGSGYPNGLKGEEISLMARILAVADVYDALSTDRPYRKALSTEQVIQFMETNAGTYFDPEIIKLFLNGTIDFLQRDP